MRHKLSGRKLNRPTAHRMLMLRGMVADLIRHEAIRTTEPKGKAGSGRAEKVMTRAKRVNMKNRRMAWGLRSDESVVGRVFDELARRYQDRPGGYTRVVKLGPRKGDAAPMAIVELLP